MSEVTRAEQLADRIHPGTDWYEFDQQTWCNEAAVELRRLSAVEADRDRWQRNRDMWKDQSFAQAVELHELRERLARQSELIQQAKEAMAEAKNWMSWAKTELDKDIPTGEPVHPVSVKLTWPASSLALDVLKRGVIRLRMDLVARLTALATLLERLVLRAVMQMRDIRFRIALAALMLVRVEQSASVDMVFESADHRRMLHAEIAGRFLFAADGAYLFVHLRQLPIFRQLASAARPVVAWRAVQHR